ncbi:PIN domain-containing protein [Haliscomenobacter hydrossis]|uniref:Ribonuclease VapC n=1 Tax=Haliscomenobacter hydrossis (strain ATCC 27775 / DSM 1100 / LMG 10767 / O) TaxID=760192 RepID=F4KQV2_HALH1|nr:PIN domain-containing protein [Haliscomenobacter hydrossis]AEE52237.1 PilT protein domain protein [Haliscomenobacter hydrossis DSM 1100]
MSSRVGLDSSVLIEYVKGSRPELLEALLVNEHLDLCYSTPVVSEYLFHYLAIVGQKAPLTVKVNKEIGSILSDRSPLDIFKPLTFINDAEEVAKMALDKMKKYNLLSNDALILSLCQFHGIQYLASFDSDFVEACAAEGVVLILGVEDLGKIG